MAELGGSAKLFLLFLVSAALIATGLVIKEPMQQRRMLERDAVGLAAETLRNGMDRRQTAIRRFLNRVHKNTGITLNRTSITFEEVTPESVSVAVRVRIPIEVPYLEKTYHHETTIRATARDKDKK